MAEQTPREEAMEDAKDAVEHFMDEIIEALTDDFDAPRDIGHYSDSYHHETHVDRSYSLVEAAEILDDLSDFEETDGGIWEGLEPREAVKAQAAYTYGNAVASFFDDSIQDINGEVSDIVAEMDVELTAINDRIGGLEALSELDDAQEKYLDALKVEVEQFGVHRKKRLKNLILEAIGRKKKSKGPKDWNPRNPR